MRDKSTVSHKLQFQKGHLRPQCHMSHIWKDKGEGQLSKHTCEGHTHTQKFFPYEF